MTYFCENYHLEMFLTEETKRTCKPILQIIKDISIIIPKLLETREYVNPSKCGVYVFGGFIRNIIQSYHKNNELTFNDINLFINLPILQVSCFVIFKEIKILLTELGYKEITLNFDETFDSSENLDYPNRYAIGKMTINDYYFDLITNVGRNPFYHLHDFTCNNLIIDCTNEKYELMSRYYLNLPQNWIYTGLTPIEFSMNNISVYNCIIHIKEKRLVRLHDKYLRLIENIKYEIDSNRIIQLQLREIKMIQKGYSVY
jgi:hypothetical protein